MNAGGVPNTCKSSGSEFYTEFWKLLGNIEDLFKNFV